MNKDAKTIFTKYINSKGLNLTRQREEILEIFTKTKKHLSVDDLFSLVKKRDAGIGHTTVFRTLKLFCEAGIAREVDLGRKVIRYEFIFGHQHHDHLVCTYCGSFIEAMDPDIERLQEKLCKKFKFFSEKHRMEIFGVCKKCRR